MSEGPAVAVQELSDPRGWPVPPHEGLTGWCIIRKDDGAMELFAIADGETWGDSDEELGPFFDHLAEKAA